MKKVLFVASIALHINSFHLPYLKWFKENGCIVDVATGKEEEINCCDNHFKVDFERSPLKANNIKAYKQLKNLINKGEYDIIHCHTPVVSIITRLAARKARKKGTKVIYTAHGLHFYKGAPLLNWLIYYPIEKMCARWTDILITINKEDFAFAQKKLKAKKVEYVPGVGIDLGKYTQDKLSCEKRKELRKSLCISEDDKLLFSVGELNNNKNHAVILKAMLQLPDNVHYCIAGQGANEQKLLALAEELGLKNRFHLLGRRTDVADLLNCADVFCFPSFREGLPVSLMEAMACGLPVVAQEIRGVVDLIESGRNGLLIKENNPEDFAKAIEGIINGEKMQAEFRKNNIEDIKKFSLENVSEKLYKIYTKINGVQ